MPIGTLGASLLAAGAVAGPVLGGLIGQHGASAAGDAARMAGQEAAGIDQGAANQAWNFAQQARTGNNSLSTPYLQSGYAATNALLGALGLGSLPWMNEDPSSATFGQTGPLDQSNLPGVRANALTNFQASPGYQWRVCH
jgi:hypothetical protein